MPRLSSAAAANANKFLLIYSPISMDESDRARGKALPHGTCTLGFRQ
jgi:hypothetical protein